MQEVIITSHYDLYLISCLYLFYDNLPVYLRTKKNLNDESQPIYKNLLNLKTSTFRLQSMHHEKKLTY